MSERDTSRPLPFLGAARGVFELSLEAMIWSRRTVVLGLLVGLPILFGIVYRIVLTGSARKPEMTGFDLYGLTVAGYYVGNILPLAALFYASALIADEVEGKTLTYLLTRPIARASILVGKFAAYLVTGLALAWPALLATFFLLVTARGGGFGAAVPDLFRDAGVIALTLLVYGALFALLGVLLRRPLVPGLLFIFAWELLARLPGYLPRLTLTVYLRSLIRHRPAVEGLSELFDQVLPASTCLPVLFVLTAAFLGAALWIFSRREYVIQQ